MGQKAKLCILMLVFPNEIGIMPTRSNFVFERPQKMQFYVTFKGLCISRRAVYIMGLCTSWRKNRIINLRLFYPSIVARMFLFKMKATFVKFRLILRHQGLFGRERQSIGDSLHRFTNQCTHDNRN